MSYQEAFAELQKISKQLEDEELTLDQIEQLLARSQELAAVCQASLRRVSDKLDQFQQAQFSE